jgi:DNA-directed RNA polymerase
MITAMEVLHCKLREGKWADLGNGVGTYGPFLALVSPEKLAVLTIHETINFIIRHGNQGVPLAMLLIHIADAVRTEVNFLRLTETYGDRVLNNLRDNGMISMKRVNRKAREALEDGLWHPDLKIKVGGMLLNELHRVAKVSPEFWVEGDVTGEARGEGGATPGMERRRKWKDDRRHQQQQLQQVQDAAAARTAAAAAGKPLPPPCPTSLIEDHERPPAFHIELETTRKLKKRGLLFLDEATYRSMVAAEDVHHYITPRYRPMVVEPRPWRAFDSGGYLQLKSYVVRSQNCKAQFEALRRASMPEVYGALNFLGRVQWVINTDVLDIIQEAYARGLTVGDLPSKKDLVVPPLPPSLAAVADDEEALAQATAAAADGENGVKGRSPRDRALLHERLQLAQRVKKRNAELFSLRCDTEIKLRIAEEFREHTFYFPYNLDFRGRAYPVPPNLNHLGSDMCRGMLRFAETRPLGKDGMRWLKIHLANLCGKDKLSFDGRVEYVEGKMEEVYDSAARPLDGKGWWQKAEEPWQALAVCKEIVAALESGDPESFLSGVPVHMDGSCNGLQHYAALGRDEEGAKQVNLIHSEVPQDVYTGVCDRVVKHVHAEATRKLSRTATEEEKRQQRYARLVDGVINRKVVKQTVMTSVYGVTYIGARKQIQARLKEKFQEREGGRMLTKEEDQDVYEASRYVATITLSKLAELFSAARNIMEWLATCASLVAKQGQPMSWVTPLGLPVIQPYRRDKGLLVKTLIQSVILIDCNDKLPVSSVRQRSAFPPNFVHSLDSTHMLMTANKLQALNIPFTAVHDSYWCHASHVDTMNASLRDCFVDLYEQPVLENLRDSLVARFPDVEFPAIPQRGQLRLDEVKDSPYFFD